MMMMIMIIPTPSSCQRKLHKKSVFLRALSKIGGVGGPKLPKMCVYGLKKLKVFRGRDVTSLVQGPKKYHFLGRFPYPTFPFRNLDNDDYEDDIYLTMMNLSVIFVMPCIIQVCEKYTKKCINWQQNKPKFVLLRLKSKNHQIIEKLWRCHACD